MIINNTLFNVDLETIILDLQAVLRSNNSMLLGTVKHTQTDIMISCPYHKDGLERRPSMGISKDTGKCHCFTCNKVVELPELISYCFNDKSTIGREGWKWLLRNYASVQVEERADVKFDCERNKTCGEKAGSSITTFVSEEELDKYRYYHPYWTKRGITDENIIALFDLGADLNSDEITMPNYDKNGNCVFVARRSVKTKFFSYPKSVEKIVYGIYQLYSLDEFPKEVYITESMIDCIYLWQFGKYACALNGLGTSSQFAELNKMPCRKFILATDNDKAGMDARTRIRKNIKNKLITEILLPEGRKDINECSPDEIHNLIEVFSH